MQFEFGRDPMREHHDADVGDDQRVHAGGAQIFDVPFYRRDLVVARQNVERDIDARAALMRIRGALAEVVEAQIARRRTHAERLAAAIHGVGAVIDGGLQPAQIACRREHLWFATTFHATTLRLDSRECRPHGICRPHSIAGGTAMPRLWEHSVCRAVSRPFRDPFHGTFLTTDRKEGASAAHHTDASAKRTTTRHQNGTPHGNSAQRAA